MDICWLLTTLVELLLVHEPLASNFLQLFQLSSVFKHGEEALEIFYFERHRGYSDFEVTDRQLSFLSAVY